MHGHRFIEGSEEEVMNHSRYDLAEHRLQEMNEGDKDAPRGCTSSEWSSLTSTLTVGRCPHQPRRSSVNLPNQKILYIPFCHWRGRRQNDICRLRIDSRSGM
jgi:hypothetical protein